MSCFGCNSEITNKKSIDEQTIKVAANMAKETGKAVAWFRDHEGRLCISTGGDPIQGYFTPHMQGSSS